MCDVQKNLFGDVNDFKDKGGIAKLMGEAMGRGMALVMSMWDDHDVNMLWLDSTYPVPAPAGLDAEAGAPRGSCDVTSGDPKDIESKEPHSYVVYKDIRYGEIGSTLADPLTPPSPPKAPTQCPHPSTYGDRPGEGEGRAEDAPRQCRRVSSSASHGRRRPIPYPLPEV